MTTTTARPTDWEHLARAGVNNPLAIRIFEHAAAGHEISPRDLSREWGVPLGNVSYHVRTLTEKRLLRETRTRPARGALAHYYRATGKGLL